MFDYSVSKTLYFIYLQILLALYLKYMYIQNMTFSCPLTMTIQLQTTMFACVGNYDNPLPGFPISLFASL